MTGNQVSPEAVEAAGILTWRWNGHRLLCEQTGQTAAISDAPLIYVSQLPALREQLEAEVRERLEKLPRFDPETERVGSEWNGHEEAVMEPWPEGEWLRREDVLAAFPPPPDTGRERNE